MALLLIAYYLAISLIAVYYADRPLSRRGRWLLWGVGALLVVTATSRPPTMPDYEGRIDSFEAGYVGDHIEPTFMWLATIAKTIGSSPYIFLFLYAVLGISLKLAAVRKYAPFIWVSVAIYLSHFYILHDLIQVRASVASAFLLLSIKPLYDRKFLPFFCLAFIASLFHYSAISIFVLYVFRPGKINRYLYAGIILAAYALALKGITFGTMGQYIPISPVREGITRYQMVMEAGSFAEPLSLFNGRQILRCLTVFLLLFHIDKFNAQYKYAILCLKIETLAIVCFLLLSDIPVLASRLSDLFFVIEIFTIPLLAYLFRPRRIAVLFPLGMGLLYLVLNSLNKSILP